MSISDIESIRVMLDLSTVDFRGMITEAEFQDFIGDVVAHQERANLDQRAVAVGDDHSLFLYQFLHNVSGNFLDFFASLAYNYTFQRFITCGPAGDAQSSQEILTCWGLPAPIRVQDMRGNEIKYTYLNGSELHNIEQFYLSKPTITAGDPLSYSAINEADLLAGEKTGFFDGVWFRTTDIVRCNTKLLDACLDAVKQNGFLILADASGAGSIYNDSLKIHKNYYADVSRHIKKRTDFESYHLPALQGLTIAKRTH